MSSSRAQRCFNSLHHDSKPCTHCHVQALYRRGTLPIRLVDHQFRANGARTVRHTMEMSTSFGGSGGGAGHVEAKVLPFRSTSTSGPMPTMGFTPSRAQSGYEAGETVQTAPDFGRHGVDTPDSAPFPSPGLGFSGPAGAREPITGTQCEEGEQGSYVTSSTTSQHPLPPIPLGSQDPTEFRRHTDAGQIHDQGEHHGDVVNPPPLYTDAPAHRAGTQSSSSRSSSSKRFKRVCWAGETRITVSTITRPIGCHVCTY